MFVSMVMCQDSQERYSRMSDECFSIIAVIYKKCSTNEI